ncbi:MAG: MBL fold metallo-hydrolase [Clostridia bacterium]|nr:MBL fold metallo-hydrolase [Clostridia bacterium]
MSQEDKKRSNLVWQISFFVILLVLIVSLVYVIYDKYLDKGMEVYFFDVGQADCTFIRIDGHTMLIDAGNKNDADTDLKITDNINIVYELKQLGVKKIDIFINTHPHEDHMGGSAAIIENFEVGLVIAPNNEADDITTEFYTEFAKLVEKKEINWSYPKEHIKIGESFNFGSAIVTILSPNADMYKDKNNYSIALIIEYEGKSILFTGDIEEKAENEILTMALEKGILLDVDVLKSAHHGSETSSSQEFLDAVKPEFVVISCGWDNTYGHPDDVVIQRYRDSRTRIFRTDMLGDIVMYINDGEIIFDTWSYLHTKKD